MLALTKLLQMPSTKKTNAFVSKRLGNRCSSELSTGTPPSLLFALWLQSRKWQQRCRHLTTPSHGNSLGIYTPCYEPARCSERADAISAHEYVSTTQRFYFPWWRCPRPRGMVIAKYRSPDGTHLLQNCICSLLRIALGSKPGARLVAVVVCAACWYIVIVISSISPACCTAITTAHAPTTISLIGRHLSSCLDSR